MQLILNHNFDVSILVVSIVQQSDQILVRKMTKKLKKMIRVLLLLMLRIDDPWMMMMMMMLPSPNEIPLWMYLSLLLLPLSLLLNHWSIRRMNFVQSMQTKYKRRMIWRIILLPIYSFHDDDDHENDNENDIYYYI